MDENKSENETPRGTFVPEFEDRRRLAVAEMFLHMEQSLGTGVPVSMLTFGQTIQNWTTSEDEVFTMGDRVVEVVNKMMGAM